MPVIRFLGCAAAATLLAASATPTSAALIMHKDLPLSVAVKLAQETVAACAAKTYAVSAVVVDRDGETIVEMRADVRPAFPDNEPRIVEWGGRIYVNGFYRHGFLLSPHYAERAADLIAASMPKANSLHLGRWLVENTPRGVEIELPSRADNLRDPFELFDDRDFR